jgi:hypothetical protein
MFNSWDHPFFRYNFIGLSFHLYKYVACLLVCQIFVFEQRTLLILSDNTEIQYFYPPTYLHAVMNYSVPWKRSARITYALMYRYKAALGCKVLLASLSSSDVRESHSVFIRSKSPRIWPLKSEVAQNKKNRRKDIAHTSLTISTWKRNVLFLGRLRFVTEYWTTMKSV